MPRKAFYIALMLGLTFTASCGDKLDPVTAEEPTEVPPTSGNGNTVTPTPVNPNGTTPATPTDSADPTKPTPTPTPAAGLCGTTATTLSYATHIAPLVTETCSSCHGAGGIRPVMTSLSTTKAAFTNNGAQDQIDSGAMPQGRTLTKNQICLFDTWVDQNFSP